MYCALAGDLNKKLSKYVSKILEGPEKSSKAITALKWSSLMNAVVLIINIIIKVHKAHTSHFA